MHIQPDKDVMWHRRDTQQSQITGVRERRLMEPAVIGQPTVGSDPDAGMCRMTWVHESAAGPRVTDVAHVECSPLALPERDWPT